MKRRALVASVLLVVVSASVCDAATCGPRGERVLLKSMSPDPDVFVWDTRERMISYAEGMWSDTKLVNGHALLSKSGTLAVTVDCRTGAVHPKYAADVEDAVGVRLVSGQFRGRYGWVASGDIHPVRAAAR